MWEPDYRSVGVAGTEVIRDSFSVIDFPYVFCYHTMRYIECPKGEKQEWFDSGWIEHLGVQVLEIKK